MKASEQPLAWEEFFWAATVVQTRVRPDQTYVPPPSFCFMPVADMMNTGPQPNMEVFDSLEYDGADGHFYGLLGAVPQHAELVQAYQPVDNSERLFRCGFLYSENPVRVAPLPEEVCREMLAAEVEGPKPLLASLRALTLEHLQEALLESLCVEQRDALQFLLSKGAFLDPALRLSLSVGSGLEVRAGRRFAKGEVVAEVPRRLVLEAPLEAAPHAAPALLAAARRGHGQWYDVLGSEEGRWAVANLALSLLRARAEGNTSPFGAYIAALPHWPDLPTLHPLRRVWPQRLLEASPMLARLYEEASACNQRVLKLLSEKDRRWALAAVVTRNFALKGNGQTALGMLPFIDFFNHCSPRPHRIDWTCSFQAGMCGHGGGPYHLTRGGAELRLCTGATWGAAGAVWDPASGGNLCLRDGRFSARPWPDAAGLKEGSLAQRFVHGPRELQETLKWTLCL
ncbi:unnamed protein product [Effrenium voratum]|nr:unnamed protein product [Effrenium voratum]